HDGPVAALVALLDLEQVVGGLVVRDRRFAAQDGEGPVALLRRVVPELEGAQVEVLEVDGHGATLRVRALTRGIGDAPFRSRWWCVSASLRADRARRRPSAARG